jgi:flagellar L-ring protein precursor FlgH
LQTKRWILFFLFLPQLAVAANLYQDQAYKALTADRKAYQVGDILTVQVLENSSATATAGTTTDKSNDTGIQFASPNTQKNYSLAAQQNFDGTGKIARSGKLLAQLSVSIVGIDKNGDLRVKGDQVIEINGEKQAINLEGRVRPKDIDEGNTIVSSRIADAHITYIGDGVLAENQHKGLLSRLISILGLL